MKSASGKVSKVLEKSQRILILGSALFVFGLVFLVLDNIRPPKSPKTEVIPQPTPPAPAPTFIPSISALKNYPLPETFQHFSFDPKHVTAANLLKFDGACKDKYVTFLIFPLAFDYRDDPTKAVVNQAINCPSTGKFSYNIELEGLNMPFGKYYTFVADQPENGLWYNPR